MASTAEKGNDGILISGGSLSAKNIAVGINATITNNLYENPDIKFNTKILLGEVARLINHLEATNEAPDMIEQATIVKKELEKEIPNFSLAKSLLTNLIQGIKVVGSISGSISAIKKLLEVIAA